MKGRVDGEPEVTGPSEAVEVCPAVAQGCGNGGWVQVLALSIFDCAIYSGATEVFSSIARWLTPALSAFRRQRQEICC